MGAVCAFITTAATVPASAQSGGYIRGDLGWSGSVNANIHDRNFPVDHLITGPNGTAGTLSDTGSGWFGGFGGGLEFLPNFRVDVVYTYRGDYHLDQTDNALPPHQFKANLSSNALMTTAYLDFPIDPSITAFAGLGVGWSDVKMSNFSSNGNVAPGGTNDNFAWQVTAGVGFPILEGVKMDVFYRYFDGGHLQTAAGSVTSGGKVVGTYSGAEGALHAHEAGVSLRFFARSMMSPDNSRFRK
jgi:opacity protein-like surface antigen